MNEKEKKIAYMAMYNWMQKKSFSNFITLYKNAFMFKHWWVGFFFRLWRIFYNTFITNKYKNIIEDFKKNYFDETMVK